MFTGFVAIFIFPTVKDGIISHHKISRKKNRMHSVFAFIFPAAFFGF